ncbi:MAG: ECF RNA polymerase sigma factor SigW [Phycisphaerae bacterium]|nr:MAG: ECF RNA polymerase sigma factor SigW [Phycisphaerae bacterium]
MSTRVQGDMDVKKSQEGTAPMDRSEELRLVQKAKRQDAAAMRALIDAHKQRLFAFVWRMHRNHHDAEEICQDAFLKAFAALDSFNPDYRFSTWLFTIAYRVTLNTLRKKRAVSGEMDWTRYASSEPDAEHELAASEEADRLKAMIWQSVDQLTPAQRATVLLFYKQEMGCQEIATILETPVATVKSHLHRARAKLKGLLSPVLEEMSGSQRILGELAG